MTASANPPVQPSDPVRTLMRWPVATVNLATGLGQVAESLAADEVGALAVIENGSLVGVISERDIVRQIAAGADLEHKRASEMMSIDPVTVGPGDALSRAAHLMREADVRHLPVVEDGSVVGILSIRDVFDLYVRSATEEAN